jgi:hypothetical protein
VTSVKLAQQQVAAVTKEIADLRKKIADQKSAAAKENATATKKAASARPASTVSAAERYLKEAHRCEEKVSKIDANVAKLETSLSRAERKLADSEDALRRSREAAIKTEQRAVGKRRREELAHARQIAHAQQPAVVDVRTERPAAKPQILRVAYLTASPTGEAARIRVDREVREVREGVRSALHRELLDIRDWPAATFPDLITALNEQRPQLVHFAGHGSEDGVTFDGTEEQDPDGFEVDYALLADALDATDAPPEVVVLNACNSFAGVEQLLRSVPVVIGMLDVISDIAAKAFAVKFYTAIASGQSLGSALKQGQAMAQYLTGEGANPEVLARDDVDISSLRLVTPPARTAMGTSPNK